jgi:O-antigen/teichoic acid export membrane protein
VSNTIRGAIYLTLSAFLFMLSGYIANIWLGRHFGPKIYGQYGVVIALLSLVNIMQSAGLPQALAKFTSENPSKKDSILKSSLIIQIISTCILTILFYLLSPILAKLLNDESLTKYLQLSALVFPIYGIYSVYVGYYNGIHKFGKQATLNSIYASVKVVSIIVFSIFFYINGALIAFIIAPLIALFFGIHIPSNVNKVFPFTKLIRFSIPIIIFSVFTTLFLSLDLFFVKSMMSSQSTNAGYYIAAQNIALIIYFCTSAASSVILPSISRKLSLGQNGIASLLINNSLKYTILILAPSVALMAATSTQLINTIYSSRYSTSASSLQILLVAYIFLAVFVLFANVLNGASKPYKAVMSAIPGLIIQSLLCIYLIPRFGLNGAAIATLIGASISVLIIGLYIKQLLNLHYPIKIIVKIIILSIVIYILSIWLNPSLLALPFMYIIIACIYIYTLIITNTINYDEKMLIKNLIPERIKIFKRI